MKISPRRKLSKRQPKSTSGRRKRRDEESWASTIVDTPDDQARVEELESATRGDEELILSADDKRLNDVEREILRRVQDGELIETNLSTIPGSGNRLRKEPEARFEHRHTFVGTPPEEPRREFEHDKEKKVWREVREDLELDITQEFREARNKQKATYETTAKRVVDACNELNAALQAAYKNREMRVVVRIPRNKKTGEWLMPFQMYPRVFRMTHGSTVFRVEPADDFFSKEGEETVVESH